MKVFFFFKWPVIVLSPYDRSRHKERTALLSKCLSKKVHLSFLGGFRFVKVAVERGEHSLESILSNTSNILAFFQIENQNFCKTSLCWIVAGVLLNSIQNAHFHLVTSSIRAFPKGFEHIYWTPQDKKKSNFFFVLLNFSIAHKFKVLCSVW